MSSLLVGSTLGSHSPNSPYTPLVKHSSQEHALRLLYALPDPVIVVSDDGYCMEINESFTALTGYSLGEVIDRPLLELNLISSEQTTTLLQQLQLQGNVQGWECEYRRKSGEVGTALLSATLTELNGQQCILLILRDISDRKRLERELQQAKTNVESFRQSQSLFLATMSHELRSPLTAILGFAQLMQDSSTLEPIHQEYLNIIHRNAGYVLNLIQDFLSAAKIEANKLPLEVTNFDLHNFLNYLQANLHPLVHENSIQLIIDRSRELPQFIQADEGKLRQILTNLLDNAIKFTPAGKILLRVKCERQEQEITSQPRKISSNPSSKCTNSQLPLQSRYNLSFEVEDTGVGIAPHELDSLFEPFVQSESGKASNKGTGLGLYLCHQLVNLMGGEITVKSHSGQGTCFQFKIPIDVPISPEAENTGAFSAEVVQQALTEMPTEWLQQLHWAARAANDRAMLHLLEQIPTSQMFLKDVLTQQIHNFDVDRLIRWLQPLAQAIPCVSGRG